MDLQGEKERGRISGVHKETEFVMRSNRFTLVQQIDKSN